MSRTFHSDPTCSPEPGDSRGREEIEKGSVSPLRSSKGEASLLWLIWETSKSTERSSEDQQGNWPREGKELLEEHTASEWQRQARPPGETWVLW